MKTVIALKEYKKSQYFRRYSLYCAKNETELKTVLSFTKIILLHVHRLWQH